MKTLTRLEPTDLLVWRRERNLNQTQLAEMLGRTRNTINAWENGRVRIPDWIMPKLEELTFTLAPKPQPKLPDYVIPDSCPQLYTRHRLQSGIVGYIPVPTHPRALIQAGLLVIDGLGPEDKIPYTILEDPRYLEVVERLRAGDITKT